MRIPCVLVALAACGSVPQHVPRLGDLPSATCTITGAARPGFDLRYHGTPIARLSDEDEQPVIRLTADRQRATAVFESASYSYSGEVTLADVRVVLAQPVTTPPWLAVTRVGIVAIDGDRAIVEPVVESWIHLASTPRFTVPCNALRFADETFDASLSTVRPLASGQTVHLRDEPGGAEVATITLDDASGRCGGGTVEAYTTAESGAFRRLRIPTSFGALHGWADTPKLLPNDTGITFCGTSGGYPAYILDSSRVCPRDVALLASHPGGATVQVGIVHAGIGIDVVSTSHGRAQLSRFLPGKLTPFVREADIEHCPQRSELSRR